MTNDVAPSRPAARATGAAVRRTRLPLLIATGAALAAVATTPALAAKPKGPACWGPTPKGCVSQSGPIGGNLSVSGGVVDVIDRFADSDKCLGMSNGLVNEVLLTVTIPITKAGTFSYKGHAQLVLVPPRSIPIALSGRFVSSTLVKITVAIHYKACKPAHLTLRYPTA